MVLLGRSFARIDWIQCRGLSGRRKINHVITYYDNLIGITKVTVEKKKMLLHVNQHSPMPNNEDKKLNRQKLQDRLKDIHGKLYRTARGSDRYLYSDNKRTLCNQTGVEVDGRIRAVRGLVT
ncbi:hypothetical protein M3Y96_01088000 [Aphelenchoides besseyi]|nr:hypothetical protein M3Y96_01088000 [Aphelenchoides besseyi]